MLDDPVSRRFPMLAFARNNLSRARARTVLAMAGITIGVVAIASLGMFGAALEQSFLDTNAGYVETVRVSPGEDAEFRTLGRDQLQEIGSYTDDPVYPLLQYHGTVRAKKASMSGTVYALDRPGPFVEVAAGSIREDWRSGAAVGSDVAQRLDLAVGDRIEVGGRGHRVAAILAASERGAFVSTDDAVVVPPEQAVVDRASVALIRTDSPNEAFDLGERLQASLNPGRDERYAVRDAESQIQRFNQQMSLIRNFLLGIGAISLLVAAVSILNVMLMSTIEREEEIGVLRATGYHRLDVLRLMLNEAALLGIVGALAGVAISLAIGMAINAQFLGGPLAFTAEELRWVVYGFAFGTLASIISGLYPAWKAANARPVEALRD